nr:hypothetical protein [Tanacetum cinerariifolium]
MNQNFFEPNLCYEPNSSSFDQYHSLQSFVTPQLPQRSNEDVRLEMAKLIKNNRILLNNNDFPHEETKDSILYKEYLEKSSDAITPILPTEEPEYSLSMGYEHLSTISKMESDEVIESNAKKLLPIPSEYEVTFDDENDDDESLSDEDVPIEEFKVYSNPLFDDEEIHSDRLDPHYFHVESDFVESLSNHDTLPYCVLPRRSSAKFKTSLRFVSIVAFCLKTVAFCLKTVAFCLKSHCVFSQNSLRFVSKLVAFYIKQDIYAVGSENRPPMLNKDNYVPWSSRIIIYARRRPNDKMIVDSIENGPYVRRMIATPREPDLPVLVPESFHEQTDEELIEIDIKRMDADDQAIQTILLGLPEDIYATVDSYETTKEIWERVRQMMKGSQNAGVQSGGNQNGLVVVPGIANQSRTGNVVATRAEGTGNGNQARCYNCRGLGHIARNCTARPRRRDAAYLQTQLLIAQKEEAGIQLQTEEFDFMVVVGDLDEIEEVNANCILMANLQHASTSGTQHDKAPVYDTDGSAENDNHVMSVASSMVQSGGTVETSSALNEEIRAHQETVYRNLVDQVAQVDMVNCNMRAINAELKSELARYKIQEQPVEISQEKSDKLEKCYQKSVYQEQCLIRKINALHLSTAKQITTLNDEISNLNKKLSKEKSSISSLMDEKKRLKHDFKIWEDKFLDKEVDLEARIKDLENILLKRDQTVQTMHMLNPKPDSFYHSNQKMALEEHDSPAVYDSEETLELAQESHEKIRFLKKEIKPANYAKINHLSGVFVPQMSKSKEELFWSNFLNEVKSSLVTHQRVVKQKMTLEIRNWSTSAHKEVHRIISHEIAPIINQVDARVQNFEIQFLQEAAKFVRDFKYLAKEADESLDKQKSLELEIERLLKASVIHDIMSIVQNGFVDIPSDLRTELDRMKEKLKLCIIKKENEYAFLWNNWYTKCEECKNDKISYDKAYNDIKQKVKRLQAHHLKTTYKNLFNSIKSNRAHAKLHDLIYENAQLRARGFGNTSKSMKNTSGTSVTLHVDKPKLSVVTLHSKKLHASTQSHSVPQPIEFNVVKHRNVIAPEMFKINPSQTPRVDLVPNKQSSASIRTNPIINSQRHVIVKENVNSDMVTASSTGLVHTARTKRPQPKGKTRNARIPSDSKSSEVKKVVTIEDHRRTLLLSKNQKTMSSECNNIKLDIRNDKSEIVCDICKQCLVTANQDACLTPSMNVMFVIFQNTIDESN